VVPLPRPRVYEAYWHLAAERQRIFFARIRGELPPWTDDPILGSFKFCNAYRASDRVSQYLIRDVIYGENDGLSQQDQLLRIIFFRLFSKIETWEAVEAHVGRLELECFDVVELDACLEGLRSEGQAIYTSAFILCANRAFGFERKHQNHLALLEEMFTGARLPEEVDSATCLEEVYNALVAYPLIGPFMAYQIAIDINYSEMTNFCEDEFTVPGPGALRGMAKCFEDTGGASPTELIHFMVDRQEAEFERLDIDFRSLFGRRLHAIDCQNLFCEVDKYSREAFPELKSGRTRIKTRYNPKRRDLDLFYPPKWGLNDVLPSALSDESQLSIL